MNKMGVNTNDVIVGVIVLIITLLNPKTNPVIAPPLTPNKIPAKITGICMVVARTGPNGIYPSGVNIKTT